jgi:short-subunit dehydrogenase
MDAINREVVVVTGASAGIGRATARAFGARGALVGMIARGRDGLEGVRREIEAAGGQALVCPVDVADAAQVEAAADRVEAAFGPIDVWVNDAMVTVFGPIDAVTPAEFRHVTEVTYLGTVYGTMAALKQMRARNRGAIVQLGSALAYRSISLQAAYCGAKSAVRGFTDALRYELLHDGCAVHLTLVQLSAFNTPQFDWARNHMPREPQPLPPIFQPEVAAEAIVWAAHHKRREVWVGWLRDLGLENYAQAFQAHDIDAEVLPRLTADDLTAIGIRSVGHRRKLLDAIAALDQGATPAVPEPQLTVLFSRGLHGTGGAARPRGFARNHGRVPALRRRRGRAVRRSHRQVSGRRRARLLRLAASARRRCRVGGARWSKRSRDWSLTRRSGRRRGSGSPPAWWWAT